MKYETFKERLLETRGAIKRTQLIEDAYEVSTERMREHIVSTKYIGLQSYIDFCKFADVEQQDELIEYLSSGRHYKSETQLKMMEILDDN